MMRKYAGILAPLLLALLTACGTTEPSQQTDVSAPPSTTPNQNSQAVQQIQSASVQLLVYYADSQLTELIEEKRGITYSNDEDKYKQAIVLLGDPVEEEHQPLWKDFNYHDISFEDGQLTIDAMSNNTYNFGSTGELFAIEALQKTLFQFSEIEEIVILVDGKPTESLMGHVDISKPLTR